MPPALSHPFICAFRQTGILDGFNPALHRIVVMSGDRVVGSITPARERYDEIAYAFEYRGATRGTNGITPIGATFEQASVTRRLISIMFNGDQQAFEAARLVVEERKHEAIASTG